MNWSNLKEERCPKCGAFLSKGKLYVCKFCKFRINLGKTGVSRVMGLEEQANRMLKSYRKHA